MKICRVCNVSKEFIYFYYRKDNNSFRNELLEACHYTNIQPLWSGENRSKSNKLCL